jgi:hypothetical protein
LNLNQVIILIYYNHIHIIQELHDKEYMGRKLVVSGAKLAADRSIGRDREESSPSSEADETVSQQA